MRVSAGGLEIEVEVDGPADGRPLLLIMGLGMQLTAWPPAFVQALVRRGFRVIRPDNRDAGLSQGFEHTGTPNLVAASLRWLLRLPVHAPYTIGDMADDMAGLLDALAIERAHVCGASLGGMVSQQLAVRHPARVESLTLMMTTSGSRRLPQAKAHVRRELLKRPPAHDREALIEHLARFVHLIGSPDYPTEPQALRERLRLSVQRAWRPDGTARQLCAVAADGDRTPLLGSIQAPTAVIHGRADPLIPAACGEDLVHRIRGATLDLVPGMGHDLPDALLERFADTIAANAARAV